MWYCAHAGVRHLLYRMMGESARAQNAENAPLFAQHYKRYRKRFLDAKKLTWVALSAALGAPRFSDPRFLTSGTALRTNSQRRKS